MQGKHAKQTKSKKKIAVIIGSIIGVIALVYFGTSAFFFFHAWPNEHFAGNNVSSKSADKIEEIVLDASKNYTLTVGGNGFSFDVTKDAYKIEVDAKKSAKNMLCGIKALAWPVEIWIDHDVSSALCVTYDEENLRRALNDAIDEHNRKATSSVDAKLIYSSTNNVIEIEKEQYGTTLVNDSVIKSVDSSIKTLSTKLLLDRSHVVAPKLLSDNLGLQKAADQINALTNLDITLKFADSEAARITKATLLDWTEISDDNNVTFTGEKYKKWLDDFCNKIDSVGTKRTYTRPDGKEITVSGGTYGWKVDRDKLKELIDTGIKDNSTKTSDVPCQSVAKSYSAHGEKDWGNRYIDIDLSEQHVYMYDDNGEVLWETDCISGSADGKHDTPSGVYYIVYKESPSKLIGYEDNKKIYETDVSFWMPFIGNSIGLHDATWQPDFGGQMYKQGYGSHGCVNISYSAAKELYGLCAAGDVVSCHW